MKSPFTTHAIPNMSLTNHSISKTITLSNLSQTSYQLALRNGRRTGFSDWFMAKRTKKCVSDVARPDFLKKQKTKTEVEGEKKSAAELRQTNDENKQFPFPLFRSKFLSDVRNLPGVSYAARCEVSICGHFLPLVVYFQTKNTNIVP